MFGGVVITSIVESSRRRALEGDSPQDSAELEGMRDRIDGVIGRLERLEEERDFYKDLLDSPGPRREISAPSVGEQASDTTEPS